MPLAHRECSTRKPTVTPLSGEVGYRDERKSLTTKVFKRLAIIEIPLFFGVQILNYCTQIPTIGLVQSPFSRPNLRPSSRMLPASIISS
jgi:hypothetical protein